MNDKFFDANTHSPQPGQILARYASMAYAADGEDKERLVELLINHSAEAAMRFATKVLRASERSSAELCLAMAKDLNNGMSREEVAQKHYEFTLEALFYANPDDVPSNDPHWSIIQLINRKEFEEKTGISANP